MAENTENLIPSVDNKTEQVSEVKSETKSELFDSLNSNLQDSEKFKSVKIWRDKLSQTDQQKVYKMGRTADPIGFMPGILRFFPSIFTIFSHVKSLATFDDIKLKAFANEFSFFLRLLVQMNLIQLKLGAGETNADQVQTLQKDIKKDTKRILRYKRVLKKAIKLFVPEAKAIEGKVNKIDNVTKDELEKFKNYLIDQQLARLNEKVTKSSE